VIEPKVLRFSASEIETLHFQFQRLKEVTDFEEDPKLAAKVASYGLLREVGTVNDELARFIFNAETGLPVEPSSLKAELIEWCSLTGIRIVAAGTPKLELRTPGFYDVVHPVLSTNADGTLHSLYIFPELIARIARSEGFRLVLVKTWGMNSVFGGFDPAKAYYQTNFWEIENNDALKFADLVRNGQVAFLGTHDLIAHIAGRKRRHWKLLMEQADRVYHAIHSYFASTAQPSIAALILPYTLGVVLDDLAQPPSYGSGSHAAVMESLLGALDRREIPANFPTLLTRFPQSFQAVIELSRKAGAEQTSALTEFTVNRLVEEIRRASFVMPQAVSN
jgi:hypothetical protein